jgi:hypothetical protein
MSNYEIISTAVAGISLLVAAGALFVSLCMAKRNLKAQGLISVMNWLQSEGLQDARQKVSDAPAPLL